MLVKKEITEDSADDSEQQCAEVESTLASPDCLYEDNCMSQDDCINVKPELEEIDVGPTVLQHMDIHYTLNKSVGDSSIEAMPCSRVEQSMEDKLRDTLFACSVHLMRLNVFQCDLCHTVYGEKHRLLQHLQATHAGRPQTSLIVKFRRTNNRTAADNKATSNNFGQMTTEVDYDETRIKSHPGQLKPLKKRLHQQRRTRSNGFKCDRTFHKQHLLSERNKLHQRDNRNAVITRVTVAGPSNQSGDKRTKTKQKPFECEVSEKRYYSKVDLNSHKRSLSRVELKNRSVNYDSSHTRKKPYYRRDEKFTRSGDLPKKNMGVETGEKPFHCKICDTRFTQSSNLARHLKVHTGERPYQCKICDAKFAKNGVLTVHMKVHTGEKPFKCGICDARFARSNGLTLHMTVHTDEKHFQCSICDVGFKRYSSLIRHMRVHRGEKPFQCKICDARFAQSSYLNSHVRIHTGEKPFQCKICDVKFAQSGGLTHHMRIHTGEKPFQCKICDARFARSSILTSHMRVHTGEKPFKCKICNARFAHSLGLTRHIAVLHNGEKPFKCKICDARFVHSSGLTRHVKVHKSEKSSSV